MTRAEARRRARRPVEPRACTEDLARLVMYAKEPPYDGLKELAVPVIAARAGVSRRTVYRVIEEDARPTQTLDLADRLTQAVGRSLEDVRLVYQECDCA